MNFKNLFLGLFITTLTIYFGAAFFYDPKFVLYIKPLIIPFFFLFSIFHKKINFSLEYLIFVLFFYLGENCILFMEKIPDLFKMGLIFYLGSYMFLIWMSLPYLKKLNFRNVLKGYTVLVVLLNGCFLILIMYIVTKSLNNNLLNCIVLLNAVSAIILSICSVLYLSTQFNQKSVFYFFGAFSIILSDVFSALVTYYLQDFKLNFIERFLHFAGFVLIYLFYIEKDKTSEIDY